MDDLPVDSEDYEMAELESGELRDRLSVLPDSLILVILSLLPMRDVVRTTLLSKPWNDLWTSIPCLSFTNNGNDFRFESFVNRFLARWEGAKVSTIKINFSKYRPESTCDVDFWVHFATKNKVEELDLSLMGTGFVMLGYYDHGYLAPECLNSCSSIINYPFMVVICKSTRMLCIGINSSLRIDGVRVSEQIVDQVLSGAPQLEVLTLHIMENYQNLNIQSSRLKKLMIEKRLLVHDYPAKGTILRIQTLNLETLEFAGIPYSKCVLIDVPSLTNAILGFDVHCHTDGDFTWNELLGETLSRIFPAIHHVEKLTLSDWCLEVIGVMEKKYLLPSSYEVGFLRLNIKYLEVEEIIILLEIFPKLKMFVIELTDHWFDEVNCQTFRREFFELEDYFLEVETCLLKSFVLQLRTVEITWLLCEASIFPFIEFLLKHATVLENIVIRLESRNGLLVLESLPLDAAQKVASMQRSFPMVELILCGL